MRRILSSVPLMMIVALTLVPSAYADFVITPGPGQSGGLYTNILFSDSLADPGPDTLLQGVVNGTNYLFDFKSTTKLIVNNANGGQAKIEGYNEADPKTNISFNNMQMYLDDPTLVYAAFEFSLKGTGSVQFTINGFTSTGTPETYVAPQTYDLGNGNEQTWFQFTTLNGEQISKISFAGGQVTEIEVGALDHPRIGEISSTPIPEPATIALLGTVLIAAGHLVRKRRRA